MAATGIICIGLLVVHIAGNLLVFRGPAAINGYSAFMHGPVAELRWPAYRPAHCAVAARARKRTS